MFHTDRIIAVVSNVVDCICKCPIQCILAANQRIAARHVQRRGRRSTSVGGRRRRKRGKVEILRMRSRRRRRRSVGFLEGVKAKLMRSLGRS